MGLSTDLYRNMIGSTRLGHFFIILTLSLCLSATTSGAEDLVNPIDDKFTKIGITPAESLKQRGYLAEEHFFTTPDGYRLCLTRGRNPLFKSGRSSIISNNVINNREPILFIHGVISTSQVFLSNSAFARPKDFTRLFGKNISLSYINVDEFARRLDYDPSLKSLPFLAMNLGHEVWLLNRRGTQKSEYKAGHLNRTVEEVLKVIPKSLFDARKIISLGGKSRRPKNKRLDFITILLEKSFHVSKSLIMDAIKRDFESVAHTFDPNYWAFTMDEQVAYDLPMAMDYILANSEPTESGKISIVGHSLGAALTLLTMSENREFEARGK